jgi:hypothetical protein
MLRQHISPRFRSNRFAFSPRTVYNIHRETRKKEERIANSERLLIMSDSYAKQLAATLRLKTDELIWLFIEAEGRLALSREWTEEAHQAGDAAWDTRYQQDIAVLESAIQHVRDQFETVLDLHHQQQPSDPTVATTMRQLVETLHRHQE